MKDITFNDVANALLLATLGWLSSCLSYYAFTGDFLLEPHGRMIAAFFAMGIPGLIIKLFTLDWDKL